MLTKIKYNNDTNYFSFESPTLGICGIENGILSIDLNCEKNILDIPLAELKEIINRYENLNIHRSKTK